MRPLPPVSLCPGVQLDRGKWLECYLEQAGNQRGRFVREALAADWRDPDDLIRFRNPNQGTGRHIPRHAGCFPVCCASRITLLQLYGHGILQFKYETGIATPRSGSNIRPGRYQFGKDSATKGQTMPSVSQPGVTSRNMCQRDRGIDSLRLVFVYEDREEDAVH